MYNFATLQKITPKCFLTGPIELSGLLKLVLVSFEGFKGKKSDLGVHEVIV